MAELETAVRCKVKTITVINNNNSGNQALRTTKKIYEVELSARVDEMFRRSKDNFAKIAEDMGAIGIRVEDPDEFKAAFERALQEKQPVVIDIVSDIEVVAPLAWEKPE